MSVGEEIATLDKLPDFLVLELRFSLSKFSACSTVLTLRMLSLSERVCTSSSIAETLVPPVDAECRMVSRARSLIRLKEARVLFEELMDVASVTLDARERMLKRGSDERLSDMSSVVSRVVVDDM